MVGCPLVVYYWADLPPVHKFRYYDNIAPNAKCQPVLVLALCMAFPVSVLLLYGILWLTSMSLTHFTNLSITLNELTFHSTLDIVFEFYVFRLMRLAVAV